MRRRAVIKPAIRRMTCGDYMGGGNRREHVWCGTYVTEEECDTLLKSTLVSDSRYLVRLFSVADGMDLRDWAPPPILGTLMAA